ncbi:hypothetical protein A0H76_948 [Hepatospora eriocheir]|uniref:Uncharacterized protein n=2 Tax=Hepatospora eriocheir TaxID=1081669 RepID=A0A1X0QHX6_9MICR|nr:hypothetical protein A0H76_948 [Hepatospora eriocheir]
MEDNEKIRDKLNKLKEQCKFSENIENICKLLINELNNTDYKVMDSFKPFILPKQNITKLLNFYKLYTESLKKIENIQIEIEKVGLSDDEKILRIKDLDDMNVLKLMNNYLKCLDDLKSYIKVNMVRELCKKSKKYYEGIVSKIEEAFFNALKRLPKVVNSIDLYGKFLIRSLDKKEFLSKYTQALYKILGFSEVKTFPILNQRTKKLTQYLNMVKNINTQIIGKTEAHNINIGLIQLIIINLKKVIGDILLKVEKEIKPNQIPSLVILYNNLRHTEGPIVDEIEDLFVYKEQILKLILNCLVHFFAYLETLDSPNIDLKTESQVLTLCDIFKSFENNKSIKREWVRKFGPSFGVYNSDELYDNFCRKCLTKVEKASNNLKNYDKYIYLINNKAPFKEFVKMYDNMTMENSIKKDVKLVIGLWKISIEKYDGVTLNRFMLKQLEKHKKYYLPNEERNILHSNLTETVEELIAANILQGQVSKLKNAIEMSYTGTN